MLMYLVITFFNSLLSLMTIVSHCSHQRRLLTSKLGNITLKAIYMIWQYFSCLLNQLSYKNIFKSFRRIKKLDPSSGLVDETSTWKLDLYFQQYSGQQLHSSLESVLKQVMGDVKVLDTPPFPSVSKNCFIMTVNRINYNKTQRMRK